VGTYSLLKLLIFILKTMGSEVGRFQQCLEGTWRWTSMCICGLPVEVCASGPASSALEWRDL
jgi:hypothetical protein